MPFYIVIDGHMTKHHFDYLSVESGRRLDATKTPGSNAAPKDKSLEESTTYAIEIMSKSLQYLDQDTTIEDALRLFKDKGIHHLPITKDSILKGLVSDRDVLWLEKFDLTKNSKLSQFMSRTILCCEEETPISHLAKVMVNEKVSALPVINSEAKLVGIITHHDILRWVYDF